MEPLRLGILGAARVSSLSIADPAHATGARLVAVAARNRERAHEFADRHRVEQVAASYLDVINNPEVEAIYNPLPNSMHAPWNLAAIAAGKHVLSEKPFASNAAEALEVHDAAQRSPVVVFEGFHYRYHPLLNRLLSIIENGTIGELRELDVMMAMPAPEPGDLRWSLPLAGGALMDLGCYSLHVTRTVAGLWNDEPTLLAATVTTREGLADVDERAEAHLRLPNGADAWARCDMASQTWQMTIRAAGTSGSVTIADFIHPQDDDRLILVDKDGEHVEHLGKTTTYTYQLEAFTAAVREGRPFPTTTDDSVRTMQLIDATYEAAGLPPRGMSATASSAETGSFASRGLRL